MGSDRNHRGTTVKQPEGRLGESPQELVDRVDRLVGLVSWLLVDQARKGSYKHEKALSHIGDRLTDIGDTLDRQTGGPLQVEALAADVHLVEGILQHLTAERVVIETHYLEDLERLLDSIGNKLPPEAGRPSGD